MKTDRRTFLLAAVSTGLRLRAQTKSPVTLTDWMKTSASMRASVIDELVQRIRSADQQIHAWVQLDPQQPIGNGPLSGIPFGVKDVIETKGLVTEYGSEIYKGRVGTVDAAIVRLLRGKGGVLLGKTHTTAFAYRTPAPTRNPRDLAHTPGGSSSGSAAAVAAGMVPLAIGTQTGGSTIRPASFCGITGFKPTFGLLSTEGVFPFAKGLDTLGFFTHAATDMAALWEAIGQPVAGPETVAFAAPEPLPDVEPAMANAFREAIGRLRRNGLDVRAADIKPSLGILRDAQRTIMFYEGARFHEQRYKEYGDRMREMGELVQEGLKISSSQYDAAMKTVADQRARFAEQFKATPIVLVPAATGPAPLGLSNTGDSSMNAPWTALGTPTLTIPMRVPTGTLPLGLQLAGDRGQDARVIQAALRVERMLA